MSRRILLCAALLLMIATMTHAVPIPTAEHVDIPERPGSPAQDICTLMYYNFCSGWLYYWTGWTPGAKVGVCFDLADCASPVSCHSLTDIWWAWKFLICYGWIDLEVFCADDNCCPIAPPLAGFYHAYVWPAWTHFVFDPPLCLTPCAPKFITLGTLIMPDHVVPYTDCNDCNWYMTGGDPCQNTWDCDAHSYVFCSYIDYCGVYGAPWNFFVQYPNTGCTYAGYSGFVADLICHVYLSCQGPTATQEDSWSEIKALFR